MAHPNSEPTLKLYRTLFIVGGLAYLVFWFILTRVNPNVYDPFMGRVMISLCILLSFALTFFNSFFRTRIVVVAYVLAYILTFYYIFLLIMNAYSSIYAIGMMTILFGIAVIFRESLGLLIYLTTCVVAVGLGYFLVEQPQEDPLLYLSILTTTCIVSYITMSLRLNIQKEVKIKNVRLNEANEEINKQKKIVEEKNNDITDSINYARKIQQSIVPSKEGLREFIPESFIYYRVKDIVSGDFFWYHKHEDELVIASVDCTGHGVPGALMSMIGLTLLKHTVTMQGIYRPSKILSNLNKEVFSFLQSGSNDGMDIAVCSVNIKKMTLSFSGAMLRIVMIRDGAAQEIKGDRFSISRNTSLEYNFTDHVVDIKKGDVFYMFTDGYADQFGGGKQKKFMYKRLEKLLVDIHQKDIQEQKNTLENIHKEWKGPLEQIDDILVIGFRI